VKLPGIWEKVSPTQYQVKGLPLSGFVTVRDPRAYVGLGGDYRTTLFPAELSDGIKHLEDLLLERIPAEALAVGMGG
jgi:hypothetical protein